MIEFPEWSLRQNEEGDFEIDAEPMPELGLCEHNKLALVTGTMDGEPYPQGKANAYLIIAAPRFLAAALKRIDEWHKDARNMQRAEPDSLRMMREALAVVRKGNP